MNTAYEAPFRPLAFIERDIQVEARADGSLRLKSRIPLSPIAAHIPELFARSSAAQPDRPWLVQRRGAQGQWQSLTYGAGKRQIDAVTQALLGLDRPGRAVMVLSGNSIEHGVLQLAAMQARMPHVPVTPAYSLIAKDLTKLQTMVDLVEPAVIFVQSGVQFERVLRELKFARDVRFVCVDAPLDDPGMLLWDDLLATPATVAVKESVGQIDHETIAKYLFTSGSTGVPKAVVISQRMLVTAVAMHRQMVTPAREEGPPVVLNWMPWSHVAAGLAQFCNIIGDAGTFYLDDGKPVAGAFEETIRNLGELRVSHFSSVPIGYAMLADALEKDESLARFFFRDLQRLGYSGAKLPDSLSSRMQKLAVAHTGMRIPFVSAYGSTETSASVTMLHWTGDEAGGIGLPHPGVEMKLVPLGDQRYDVRVKSPAVTPGYLRDEVRTREAFDEEGYFLMGDAVRFTDPARPQEGLVFAGRVAEEFKLQSGIFVRVGTLRVEALDSAQGLLSDVVVGGADQEYVGLLVWPNMSACRTQGGLEGASVADIAKSPWLRDALRSSFARHNLRHTASSMRVRRLIVLEQPPRLDIGEITDKGYVNQRMVLSTRAVEVERLFADRPDPGVILVE